jgi:phosphopantetheine--protein transferase-like protein
VTGEEAPGPPDASVFLCCIGGPPDDSGGGDPRSLIEAADMLEVGARDAPDAGPAALPAVAMSVAAASVRLDPTLHLDEAWRYLSDVETRHAERFFKEADRTRYVLAHAMLRTLLAHRLAVAPTQIAFAAEPNGKPLLAGLTAETTFNLSYSDGIVALAFARRPVGVDVEAVRDDLAFVEIGHRFFQVDELRYLEASVEPGIRDRFFRLWTRKEAVLKALGVGLSGIGELSVLRDVVVTDGVHGGERRIALRSLPSPPGHALALAVDTGMDG